MHATERDTVTERERERKIASETDSWETHAKAQLLCCTHAIFGVVSVVVFGGGPLPSRRRFYVISARVRTAKLFALAPSQIDTMRVYARAPH